ncbi:MAG TPA: hypothetical protein VMI75_14855 [Polyangiaceae bacterium]|nr:hypothetical protein [Polyangiaceae bacterium]
MHPVVTQLIGQDRGLGTAYERWCFYQLVDKWAAEYGVETALEGPVDGMAGVSGVHCVGLAKRGARVTVATTREEKAAIARGVYAAEGAAERVDVRVVPDLMRAAEVLPPSDMVIAYHSVSLVDDWRGYLHAVAKLARKVLVVTECNPDNWGFAAVRTLAKLRGRRDLEPPETWRTDVLAPELWSIGRVRDHVYFDAPWWPDLPVSPGQSLLDRARQLAGDRRARFTGDVEEAKLASRFVYGPERWPYFGGPGWVDELFPAIIKHPGFEGMQGRLRARVAHLHAFVVDVRPRTPQARRKLAQAV